VEYLMTLFNRYFYWFSLPAFKVTDAFEILILTFLIYKIIKWIKDTKAWMLLRGLIVIGIFVLLAALFQMTTILWLLQKLISILAISAVIVFQPELRRALEKLGERSYLSAIIPVESTRMELGLFTDRIVNEIVKACVEMGRKKTGALIVVERQIKLSEYERTGIMMDSLVSSQLLLNIFEHNTPLHDGAIIVRGNRIVAATCYLPLSDNRTLSKELGTRHRAGLGLSEVSDAVIIIVSEETGMISVAEDGRLSRNLDADALRERLKDIQQEPSEKKKRAWWHIRKNNKKNAKNRKRGDE
jgi:diadenylate cyclase